MCQLITWGGKRGRRGGVWGGEGDGGEQKRVRERNERENERECV